VKCTGDIEEKEKGAEKMREETLYEEVGAMGRLYYNRQRGRIRLAERSHDLEVFSSSEDGDRWVPLEPGESIDAPLPYQGALAFKSVSSGRHEAVLENVFPPGKVQDKLRVRVVAYHLSVDVDADRDGEVGVDEPGKANWVWGKGQPGAIVLVNNDRDRSDVQPGEGETSELADLLVRPTGLSDVSLNLRATEEDANRFSVYRKDADGKLERILGKAPGSDVEPKMVSPPLSPEGEHCLIEAHEYPSSSFEGLLTVELFASVGDKLIGRDRAVFRVAPWIMTPNTLPVERVYACDVTTSKVENSEFLSDLKEICESLGVPDLLEIIPPNENKSLTDRDGDRWIQDEVEFGFSQSATHTLPVVCDSPRDRGLDAFPELRLLGPDFGHFQVEASSAVDSLDYFGNLEVSPPVSVGKRRYPLGRIVFGGADYRGYGEKPRRMMPELRRFLHAQKVQSPIEIFTDWLEVGHVDEILSFVPTENEKGFKLLLASPSKTQAILWGLSVSGHGDAVLFEGKTRNDDDSAKITVDELLDWSELWDVNAGYQKLIDLNREILTEELGLDDADVFAIPVLYFGQRNERTKAFFPNMVNHLVIESSSTSILPKPTSIVPKPYGPVVNGKDAFEEAFCATVPERDVRFIDDWYSYHQMVGEVHCGTNARRTPFPDVRWWEHRPEGAYDL
jgi:protein-arginine deiminase